jgi:hypothetical protein
VVDPAILSNIKFALPVQDEEDKQQESAGNKPVISKAWKPYKTISAVCSGGNFEFSKTADVAFSLHDGKVFCSKTENMEVVQTIEFENEYFVTFTTRGDMMITTSKNGGLRLWNLATGT